MRFLSLVVLLSIVVPLPARGDDDPELTSLIAEAVEQSPEIRAAREASDAARQRVRPAEALPDPMLSLGYENDGAAPSLGTEPMTRLQLMAQQAIPFPGKLKLSGKIADAQAAESATRIARARLGVEAAVRRAWAALVSARESLTLTDEQIATWKEIGEITRSRYAAGMGNQQDVLRAQSERTRLEQQRIRDEAAGEIAQVELSRILLRPVDVSVTAAASTRRLQSGASFAVPEREAVLREAEAKSPELEEARMVRERAGLGVALAKRAFSPDFVVQAGYGNRGGLPMMWSAGVGVTVPLWTGSKQKPLLLDAEGRERAAKAAEEAVRARLMARTTERLVRLSQLSRETRLDTEGILVQDRLTVDAALASYTTGGVPFLTVLEALSTLYVDRRAAISRIADTLKTDADLRELSLDAASGPPMSPAAAPFSSTAKM
jgi:cobalt-zinc-cadmium efflux system outer membrane protein